MRRSRNLVKRLLLYNVKSDQGSTEASCTEHGNCEYWYEMQVYISWGSGMAMTVVLVFRPNRWDRSSCFVASSNLYSHLGLNVCCGYTTCKGPWMLVSLVYSLLFYFKLLPVTIYLSSCSFPQPLQSADDFVRVCKYKVLVIGDRNTGKTSIIKRYVQHHFSDYYTTTVSSVHLHPMYLSTYTHVSAYICVFTHKHVLVVS